MQILVRAGSHYLDAPDILARGQDVMASWACHEGSESHVVLARVKQDSAEPLWRSPSLRGLVSVRLVDSGRGTPLLATWCMEGPTRSRVVLVDPDSEDRVELSNMAECGAAALEGGVVAVVGRRGESVVLSLLDPDGSLREEPVCEPGVRVFHPSLAAAPHGGLLVAWEQECHPGCGIFARQRDRQGRWGPVTRLDDGDITCHVPEASSHPQGVLVCYHAPARFSEPQLLVKDVRLVLVGEREVLWPEAGPDPAPGEEPRGEVQGFEFPVALPDPSGGVDIMARGSHCYYRRRLDGGGWRDPEIIDEALWGCRGPCIRSTRDASARLWTATRERHGIVIRRLHEPAHRPGGAAGFVPRTLRCTGPEAERRPSPRPRPADARQECTWFGDIHQHSAVSDGTGAPHETYIRARDFYDDDLVALTDHESFIGKRTPVGEWAYLKSLALRFDDPPAFTTLMGYEWTGAMMPGPGHKVVYVEDPDTPLVSRDDSGAGTGRGLLSSIAPMGAVAIPHHVGWTGADEQSHTPELQPCFEVVSCHGAYEDRDDRLIGRREPDRGPFILELLRDGLRFGFTGGSDGHGLLYQHGVSRKRDAHRTGLTAVVARSLDRHCVMEAIRGRSVYATTGVRMELRVFVDGEPMGAEVRAGSRCAVQVRVQAGAPVSQVVLISASRRWDLPARGEALEWSRQMDLSDPLHRFLYLKVVRQDGECGWTSPVFFNPGP